MITGEMGFSKEPFSPFLRTEPLSEGDVENLFVFQESTLNY